MLEVKDLHKSFGKEEVLRGVDFTLEKGEVLSVLGQSGSGKTTLLKILAGLETADSGEILLDDQSLKGMAPNLRGIVYLYQEPLLFPHLNVSDNIAFGLRLRKVPSAEVHRKTGEMLEHLGIADQAEKMPHQLSGGQKQRVSFGRALIINPRILLLDEPFGNLDAEIRALMQDLYLRMAATFHITSMFITHDLREALRVGTRMAMMREGKLQVYRSQAAFVQDPATGAADEISFWQNLGNYLPTKTS